MNFGLSHGPIPAHERRHDHERCNAMIKKDETYFQFESRRHLSQCSLGVLLAVACAVTGDGSRPRAQRERPALNITGYVIDAELDTTAHHLTATATCQLYRARQSRRRQFRLSSRAQGHQNHR